MFSERISRRRAVALLCFIALAWGASWPITKVIVREVSPLWSTAFRSAIAAAVLAALLTARGQFIVPRRGDVPVLLSTSLLYMTAYSALVAASLQFLPAGRAIVAGYATPIWVTLGARIFLSERITTKKTIGVIAGIAGLGVIFNPGSMDWSDHHALLGTGLVTLASFCWGINIVYIRAHKWISSPFQLVFWQLLLAFATLSSVAWLVEGIPRVIWTPSLVSLLLLSGAVCVALGHWAMTVVNRTLPALTTSLGLLATPAVGIVSSAGVLGEALEPSVLLALALLVGGIALGMSGRSISAC